MKTTVILLLVGVLAVALCGCIGSARPVQDDFAKGKELWSTWHDPKSKVQCESVVNATFGSPAPALSLTYNMNNCLGVDLLDGVTFTNGTIELDVYLQPNALVDVAFRADYEKNTGYIARLDSRDFHDTFLKIDTWTSLGQNSGHATSPLKWHHMRIEVEGSSFTLYCDDQQVATATGTEFASGRIALTNEVGSAYVDNIVVSPKSSTQAATAAGEAGTAAPGEARPSFLAVAGLLIAGTGLGCVFLLAGIVVGYTFRHRIEDMVVRGSTRLATKLAPKKKRQPGKTPPNPAA